jgi:hypothetical protein
MARVRRSHHGSLALAALALVVLAACQGAPAGTRATPATAARSPGATATAATVASPTPFSLTSDCPEAGQPAIRPGASLTLQPTSGPVGTQIAVTATGLQPGCHLWLGLNVAPCTCETDGVVERAPRLTDSALQWISVDDAGAVRTTVCLCGGLLIYALGYPPYPSVTPPAMPGSRNVGEYWPHTGDHFFLTIAGATIGDPPPLFALFTVTG